MSGCGIIKIWGGKVPPLPPSTQPGDKIMADINTVLKIAAAEVGPEAAASAAAEYNYWIKEMGEDAETAAEAAADYIVDNFHLSDDTINELYGQ
jgi:hypothetical protein